MKAAVGILVCCLTAACASSPAATAPTTAATVAPSVPTPAPTPATSQPPAPADANRTVTLSTSSVGVNDPYWVCFDGFGTLNSQYWLSYDFPDGRNVGAFTNYRPTRRCQVVNFSFGVGGVPCTLACSPWPAGVYTHHWQINDLPVTFQITLRR